jgi:hypothetical protein
MIKCHPIMYPIHHLGTCIYSNRFMINSSHYHPLEGKNESIFQVFFHLIINYILSSKLKNNYYISTFQANVIFTNLLEINQCWVSTQFNGLKPLVLILIN